MEIYLERIRDLLARRFHPLIQLIVEAHRTSTLTAQNDNLQIHEEKSKGIYVKNLSDFYVSNAREVYEIMRQGGASRVVSSTSEHKPSPRFCVKQESSSSWLPRHER